MASASLTLLAEDYLLDQSPTYFGTYLDLIINNYSVCSLEQLEKAAQTDTAQAYAGGQEMFKSHAEQADLARFFTRTMHSTSMGPALAWPEVVDLSGREVMLDVGGVQALTRSVQLSSFLVSRESCSMPLRCARSQQSSSLITTCKHASGRTREICGRIRSHRPTFTSIQ